MDASANSRRVQFVWVASTAGDQQKVLFKRPSDPLLDRSQRTAVVDHLHALGHIEGIGAATPKDELLALLRVAAEVEHALLVQYLYAAASLERGPIRQLVRDVAIQEMAHLITVQNLLLALGGPSAFHIGRDVARSASEFDPLPFDLEPASVHSLAEFVLAERPHEIPAQHQAKVLELEALVSGKAGRPPLRVGALYARIYWLLQPGDQPSGPLELRADPNIGFDAGWHVTATDFVAPGLIAEHQADPEEWHHGDGPDLRIHTVWDAASALTAVHSVMAQGEGPAQGQDSHFDYFLEALRRLEANPGAALPLPVNPYVGCEPICVTQGTRITHDYVRLWANLLNVRYSGLLLTMGQVMLTPRSDADRSPLIEFFFDVLMGRNLGALIAQMTTPHMRALDPVSAPTFELLREDMPASLDQCWQRHSRHLDLERGIREALRQHQELANDVHGSTLLDSLEESWQELRGFVDLHLP